MTDQEIVHKEQLEHKPRREWRGLTTAERKVLWNLTKKPSEFAELIEKKLKEKNHD